MEAFTISLAAGLDSLCLRPLGPADVEPVYQACQDPAIGKGIAVIPVPYTRSDAETFVHEIVPTGWEQDTAWTWAVAEPDSPDLLGVIGLTRVGVGCDEVGYWLAPAARGRGLATAALAGACGVGFDRRGLQSILWRALAGNDASRRVAERVGFQISGPIRRVLEHRGEWVDGWIGTLLPDDKPPVRD